MTVNASQANNKERKAMPSITRTSTETVVTVGSALITGRVSLSVKGQSVALTVEESKKLRALLKEQEKSGNPWSYGGYIPFKP